MFRVGTIVAATSALVHAAAHEARSSASCVSHSRWQGVVMLYEASRNVVVVVDIQERLAPAIHDVATVIAKSSILIQTARTFSVPVLASEQYPKGLGKTIPELAEHLPVGAVVEKIEFSAAANPLFGERLAATGRRDVILCGIEAHVCVLQTALDLLAQGDNVTIVADAVSSRRPVDAETALRRADNAGATIATTEMVVFEWLRRADHPDFRTISRLLK